MGGVAGYAAIHSRIRVMYSELLTRKTGPVARRGGLQSLIELLKDTPYVPI